MLEILYITTLNEFIINLIRNLKIPPHPSSVRLSEFSFFPIYAFGFVEGFFHLHLNPIYVLFQHFLHNRRYYHLP